MEQLTKGNSNQMGGGDVGRSKNVKIRLMGHCIICLRKVRSGQRHGQDPSGKLTADGGDVGCEAASKLEVTSPAFVATFNEIWGFLQREKGIISGAGISLTTVITGMPKSLNVKFSQAPTLCQLCCDKIVAVENLMKAVRQQVREIRMLVKACRKGGLFGNRLEQFGRDLRENKVEEEAIKLTLKFVDIFDSLHEEQQGQPAKMRVDSDFQPNIQPKRELDQTKSSDSLNPLDFLELSTTSTNPCDDSTGDNPMSFNEDNENGKGYSENIEDNKEDEDNDKISTAKSEEDDDDPDYIKSEQDDDAEEDYDDECSSGDEDEEEMENSDAFDSDADANDPLAEPPTKVVKKAAKGLPQSSKETFTCDVGHCTKSHDKAILLEKHKFVNHYSMVICEVDNCKRKLDNETTLLNHKWRCHPNELSQDEKKKISKSTDQFPCSCGKNFAKEDLRSRHLLTSKPSIHPEYKSDDKPEEKKKYDKQKCDMCREVVHFSDLLEHVTRHVGEDFVYRCPNVECSNIYTSSKMWQRHFGYSKICREISLEKMNDLSLCCESCGVKITNRYKLENHVKNEHERRRGRESTEKKWRCPISGCGKTFRVKQSIYFHMHVHSYRQPITKINQNQVCDECGKCLKIEEMEGHLKEEHGIEEVILCKQCPFKFGERDEMVERLWEHRGTGISCDICGDDKRKKYFRYSGFREHYFEVHKECPKKYKCGECDKWFWRKKEVETHRSVRHGKGEGSAGNTAKREFPCDLCEDGSVKFKMENNLISHKIKVHGADPFSCDICGEDFSERRKFTKHVKEHAGVEFQKEWRCEVEGCGKIFKYKKGWKDHVEVVHGGQRRHVCEVCGKGFGLAATLKTHRDAVHLGLRPWVCDDCGERFTSDSVLKRHKLIHTGERPFGCDICGQRFRHQEVLRRHKVGHEEKGAGFKPNGPMKQNRKRKKMQ